MKRAFLVAILCTGALAAPAGAQERATLPPDARIAGVAVGGMDRAGADRELRRVLGGDLDRPVTVRVGARDQAVTPAAAGLRVDYAGMVRAAFAAARAGRRVDVRRRLSVAQAPFDATIRKLAAPFYRAPRNARAVLGITRIKRIRSRMGYGLDQRELRRRLGRELRNPTEFRVVKGQRVRVPPAVTTSGLRRRYPAYVSIDRGTFTLRLFRALRLVRTYRIAVGRAGNATPRGMRRVLYKDKNPSWTAPNSAWAAPYQGQTFPPGHPNNPLRAWFIGLGDAYGIHGTSEEWTIGTRASRGCIRMRARDVSRLAPLVPVGTPVRIR